MARLTLMNQWSQLYQLAKLRRLPSVDSEVISEKSAEPEPKEEEPQQVKDLSMEDKELPESEDKQPEPDPEPQPSGKSIVFLCRLWKKNIRDNKKLVEFISAEKLNRNSCFPCIFSRGA